MPNAQRWIDYLKLMKHPEGGYFREIYRSSETIAGEHLPPRFDGPRALSTAIYFLLPGNDFSAFHRLRADELWHFYSGCALTLYIINSRGILSQIMLGSDPAAGEVLQAVVPHGSWFAARPNDSQAYTLVGCTVAPGFDFMDFELGGRGELIKNFPQHKTIIEKYTRP